MTYSRNSAGEIILVEEAPLIAAQKSMREPLHMQVDI
jgi:hypothetical protein